MASFSQTTVDDDQSWYTQASVLSDIRPSLLHTNSTIGIDTDHGVALLHPHNMPVINQTRVECSNEDFTGTAFFDRGHWMIFCVQGHPVLFTEIRF